MEQNVLQFRGGLKRTLEGIKKGSLTIGFIGGSITDGRPGHNWPEPTTAWFVENFPNVRIHVENAAIGATGSDLAVFRAKRDLIDRNCDLVFVEYAVNDGGTPTEKRNSTREGLIRKLLSEERDVVLVYTYSQDMYKAMAGGQVPDTISEFEEIGKYYNIGSVWMGLNAFEEVNKGRMRWEEWLPDGLHPQYRGSLSYAHSVMKFLEKELIQEPGESEILGGSKLPEPMFKDNWENAFILPFSEVKTEGPWVVKRWPNLVWVDQVLETAAVGAKLSFPFEGRGLCLGFIFGKTSSEFKYRLDGGEWVETHRDRPGWVTEANWYRVYNIEDGLTDTKHKIEIEVIHGDKPECTGTNFVLTFIGVIN